MILKFHIQYYLHKSKKWYLWHSLAASFTYRTLKSGLDLQCRQPGQAEEKLGDEEPGPVAPSDAALQRLYIA